MSSGSNVAQSRSAMLTSVQQATKNVFKTYVMQQQSNPNFAFTQEPQVISLIEELTMLITYGLQPGVRLGDLARELYHPQDKRVGKSDFTSVQLTLNAGKLSIFIGDVSNLPVPVKKRFCTVHSIFADEEQVLRLNGVLMPLEQLRFTVPTPDTLIQQRRVELEAQEERNRKQEQQSLTSAPITEKDMEGSMLIRVVDPSLVTKSKNKSDDSPQELAVIRKKKKKKDGKPKKKDSKSKKKNVVSIEEPSEVEEKTVILDNHDYVEHTDMITRANDEYQPDNNYEYLPSETTNDPSNSTQQVEQQTVEDADILETTENVEEPENQTTTQDMEPSIVNEIDVDIIDDMTPETDVTNIAQISDSIYSDEPEQPVEQNDIPTKFEEEDHEVLPEIPVCEPVVTENSEENQSNEDELMSDDERAFEQDVDQQLISNEIETAPTEDGVQNINENDSQLSPTESETSVEKKESVEFDSSKSDSEEELSPTQNGYDYLYGDSESEEEEGSNDFFSELYKKAQKYKHLRTSETEGDDLAKLEKERARKKMVRERRRKEKEEMERLERERLEELERIKEEEIRAKKEREERAESYYTSILQMANSMDRIGLNSGILSEAEEFLRNGSQRPEYSIVFNRALNMQHKQKMAYEQFDRLICDGSRNDVDVFMNEAKSYLSASDRNSLFNQWAQKQTSDLKQRINEGIQTEDDHLLKQLLYQFESCEDDFVVNQELDDLLSTARTLIQTKEHAVRNIREAVQRRNIEMLEKFLPAAKNFSSLQNIVNDAEKLLREMVTLRNEIEANRSALVNATLNGSVEELSNYIVESEKFSAQLATEISNAQSALLVRIRVESFKQVVLEALEQKDELKLSELIVSCDEYPADVQVYKDQMQNALLQIKEEQRMEQERIKEEERLRLQKEEEDRKEKERLENERLKKIEEERLEKERIEKEEAERLEQERIEREETERLEREEAERIERERVEQERIGKERREREEAERLEELRIQQEAERLERERVEREEAEKLEQLRKEQEEAQRIAREKEEADRLALVEKERTEREEAERLERERVEKEEADRLEQLRIQQEAERIEKERVEREEAERVAREELERLETLRIQQEEVERKQKEAEKEEAERLERERIQREEAERLEKQRIEKEEAKKEAERLEKLRIQREEAERIERERVEREEAERLEQLRKEQEEAQRIAREKEEADRLALVEKERIEREEAERLESQRIQQEEAARLDKERVEKEEAKRIEQIEQERIEKERMEQEALERIASEQVQATHQENRETVVSLTQQVQDFEDVTAEDAIKLLTPTNPLMLRKSRSPSADSDDGEFDVDEDAEEVDFVPDNHSQLLTGDSDERTENDAYGGANDSFFTPITPAELRTKSAKFKGRHINSMAMDVMSLVNRFLVLASTGRPDPAQAQFEYDLELAKNRISNLIERRYFAYDYRGEESHSTKLENQLLSRTPAVDVKHEKVHEDNEETFHSYEGSSAISAIMERLKKNEEEVNAAEVTMSQHWRMKMQALDQQLSSAQTSLSADSLSSPHLRTHGEEAASDLLNPETDDISTADDYVPTDISSFTSPHRDAPLTIGGYETRKRSSSSSSAISSNSMISSLSEAIFNRNYFTEHDVSTPTEPSDVLLSQYSSSNDSTHLKLIIDLPPAESLNKEGKISYKTQLEEQKGKCPTCDRALKSEYGWLQKPRYCYYTNQYYCKTCHSNNEKMVIPAIVLWNWNFTPYTVCDEALNYLKTIQNSPIIVVSAVNPMAFDEIANLRKARMIRKRLIIQWDYIAHCPQKDIILKRVGVNTLNMHLITDTELYSMKNLIDMNYETTLSPFLKQLVFIFHQFSEHITTHCGHCIKKAKTYCAANCKNTEALFEFNTSTVIKCPMCYQTFHKKCFSVNGNQACPRCSS